MATLNLHKMIAAILSNIAEDLKLSKHYPPFGLTEVSKQFYMYIIFPLFVLYNNAPGPNLILALHLACTCNSFITPDDFRPRILQSPFWQHHLKSYIHEPSKFIIAV